MMTQDMYCEQCGVNLTVNKECPPARSCRCERCLRRLAARQDVEIMARNWLEARPHTVTCWRVVSGAPCDCRKTDSLVALIFSAAEMLSVEARA